MNRSAWKKRAEQYEQRFEELFQRKTLEKNKVIKKQLQARMNFIRELQKDALRNYHNFKKGNK
jgi:hypothetical protein